MRQRKNANFAGYDADSAHQHMAGLASWAAFSARWRARQGLPLLHPMDVQYLTPQDFRNGMGAALPAAEQRRLFRGYVRAAMGLLGTDGVAQGQEMALHRPPLPMSSDLAFVRAEGFCRSCELRPDFVYGGRDDVSAYEHDAMLPPRPYGIPTTSSTFEGYWLDGATFEEEEW